MCLFCSGNGHHIRLEIVVKERGHEALYFMNYNFCRIHQTLRCTTAMEAGITDHVWDMEEVVALIDQVE